MASNFKCDFKSGQYNESDSIKELMRNLETSSKKNQERGKQFLCNQSHSQMRRKSVCDSMKRVIEDIEKFEGDQMDRKYSDVTGTENKKSTRFKKPNINFEKKASTSTGNENETKFVQDENFLNKFIEQLIQLSQYERLVAESVRLEKERQNNDPPLEVISEESDMKHLLEDYEKVVEQRQQELASKRVQDRMAKQKRLVYLECLDITYSLVRLVFKFSPYRHIDVPIDEVEQRKEGLIIKECASDFSHSNVSKLLLKNDTADALSGVNREMFVEPSISQEPNQKTFVQNDVDDYLRFERQWASELSTHATQNVLGFIVTKLLDLLSSTLTQPNKVPLPDFRLAVSLHGIPKIYYLLIKKVLEDNNIVLFDETDAINYCVAKFKQEASSSELAVLLSTLSLDKKSSRIEDSTLTSIFSVLRSSVVESEVLTYIEEEEKYLLTKETQTTNLLPENLSYAAEVGKKILKRICLGEHVTSDLLANSVIGFLSEQTKWKGFVILNVPKNLNEMHVLESSSTGQVVPFRKYTVMHNATESTQISELVPQIPNRTTDPKPFIPYINYFIHVKSDVEMSEDLISVYKFYSKFNMHKEFKFERDSNRDLDVIKSVLHFILFSLHGENGDISLMLDNIDHSQFKTSRTSKLNNLRSQETYHFNDIELQYENDTVIEEMSDVRSEATFKCYADFEAPESILKSLATTWQNMEQYYMESLKIIFSLKREDNFKITNFGIYVENIFNNSLKDFNNKKELICSFQDKFNTIKKKNRDSLELENILHDRVFELQNKLWEICDENNRQREKTANFILKSRWFIQHINGICEGYFSLLNNEQRRYACTMQLLTDYYRFSLKRVPPSEKVLEFEEKHIKLDTLDEYVEFVCDEGFYISIQPICYLIKNIFQCFKDELNSVSIINSKFYRLEPKIRVQMESAVADENLRILTRAFLIEENMLLDVQNFELWYSNLLNKQFHKLKAYYENEVANVDLICNSLKLAIEDCNPLSQKIIPDIGGCLGHSNDSMHILGKPSSFSNHSLLSSKSMQQSITPIQSENLVAIFQNVSPSGFILRSSFIFMLQDLLVENSCTNCLPSIWKTLKPETIEYIAAEVFGDVKFYDWRDFIIFSYEVPYPSMSELINMNNVFKTLNTDENPLIYWNNFFCSTLWFEKKAYSSSKVRLKLTKFKKCLFKLFQVDKSRANYFNLLFHLCKDFDPVLGLWKALYLVSLQQNHLLVNDCQRSYIVEEDARSDVSWNLEDSSFLSGISYQTLYKTISNCFQYETQLPKDIEQCLKSIESRSTQYCFTTTSEILADPCLYNFIHSVHKFKACTLSDIVIKYLN